MVRKLSSSRNNTPRNRKNNGKSSKKKCSRTRPSHQGNSSLLSNSTDKCLSALYLFSYFHFMTVIVISLKKGLEKFLHNFEFIQIGTTLTENLGWISGCLRNIFSNVIGFIVTTFVLLLRMCTNWFGGGWCFVSCLITKVLPRLLLKLVKLSKVFLKSAAIICLDFGLVCWRAVKSFIPETSRTRSLSISPPSTYGAPFREIWRRKMASSSASSTPSSMSPPLRSPSMIRRPGGGNGGSRWSSTIMMGGTRPYSPPARNGTMFLMDCHMDWIDDIIPKYLPPSEKENFVTGAIQKLKEWLEEIKERIINPGSDLNVMLMLAGFHAYLSKFNDALDWITEALDSLKMMTDENAQHLRAYSYLIRANFYKINRRMKLMEGMGIKLIEEVTAKDLKEIEILYTEDNVFQAVMCLAKAMLAGTVARQDLQLDLYQKAIWLDPTCAQWHRMLYQVLRKKRREQNRHVPSNPEKMAMTKAFTLKPNCCLNQSMYASMLEENLKGNKEFILNETREETGNQIITLMRMALESNPEDKWTNVRLAEVFAYGNFPHLEAKDGELMFRELEKRWPDSSMVLHKFGKYFAMVKKDYKEAVDYFTRALECDAGNFPCLMDYLKAIQRIGTDYKKMLAMVDKCSMFLHNTSPMVRLLLARGILLWLLEEQRENGGGTGKQEACHAWMEAAIEDINSCGYIAKMINSGYWNVLGEYQIDVVQVMSILSVFLNATNGEKKGIEQAKSIRRLMSELQNQEMGMRRPYGMHGVRHRTLSGSSSRSSSSSSSYVTAKSSWSQADAVDNWRDNSPPPAFVEGSGVFAKYEDPLELQLREKFKNGLNLGPTKKIPFQPPYRSSLADQDNDWRH